MTLQRARERIAELPLTIGATAMYVHRDDILRILDEELADDLGAAWAEAEGAVRRGQAWFEVWRRSAQFEDKPAERYWASIHNEFDGQDFDGSGPTPAAALAAALRERRA